MQTASLTTLARRRQGNGYTITEILVVIVLIILLIAIAVPAFNVITGSRSVEGAENIVSAVLARARSMALNATADPVTGIGGTRGVAFFVDPTNGRTTLAIVQQATNRDELDPIERYKAWQPGVQYFNATFDPTSTSQRVIHLVRDPLENNKLFTRIFRCKTTHTSSSGNAPQLVAGPNNTVVAVDPWELSTDASLDLVTDLDFTQLPPGVSVQTINDPRGSNNNDRYLRTGVILFDPQGRVTRENYSISAASPLGKAIGLATDIKATQGLYTQFGVVLYDREDFVNQPGFTEGDAMFTIPTLASPGAYGQGEAAEETWLDQNTVPRVISRATGTLQDIE